MLYFVKAPAEGAANFDHLDSLLGELADRRPERVADLFGICLVDAARLPKLLPLRFAYDEALLCAYQACEDTGLLGLGLSLLRQARMEMLHLGLIRERMPYLMELESCRISQQYAADMDAPERVLALPTVTSGWAYAECVHAMLAFHHDMPLAAQLLWGKGQALEHLERLYVEWFTHHGRPDSGVVMQTLLATWRDEYLTRQTQLVKALLEEDSPALPALPAA